MSLTRRRLPTRRNGMALSSRSPSSSSVQRCVLDRFTGGVAHLDSRSRAGEVGVAYSWVGMCCRGSIWKVNPSESVVSVPRPRMIRPMIKS